MNICNIILAVFMTVVSTFCAASEGQKNITAESGQNITLICRAANNIIAVNWSRADLGDKYVLLFRDGHFDSHKQHPSFRNRVDLHDRQMKDGDVSLILNNVTINDTGTYKCRVFKGDAWESFNISLSVAPPGPGGGAVGVVVGLSVAVGILGIFMVFIGMCCKVHKTKMSGLECMNV